MGERISLFALYFCVFPQKRVLGLVAALMSVRKNHLQKGQTKKVCFWQKHIIDMQESSTKGVALFSRGWLDIYLGQCADN